MGLNVTAVESRRDLGAFIALAWKVYADDPNWVPPLKADQAKLLTKGRHPFQDHADVQPFLARRDGRPVGRIVATVNRAHNEFHGDKLGFLGLYECLEGEEEASALLFEIAFDWLRERGCDSVQGPMDLSTNEECGLFIEGEPGRPMVMMPYNPPSYPARYEAAGLTKEKDLLAFMIREENVPDKLMRIGDAVMKRSGVRTENIDMKNFASEVDRVLSLYNQCWEKNWGFVPMTDAEVKHMADELRMAVDPALILFLIDEASGKDLGFMFALPDLNEAIRHANGKLFPIGIFKILWYKRKIEYIRVLTLGLIPEARGKGFDGVLITKVVRDGLAKGYKGAECSWVLEDNMPMIAPLMKMTGGPYRTYRVYKRAL